VSVSWRRSSSTIAVFSDIETLDTSGRVSSHIKYVGANAILRRPTAGLQCAEAGFDCDLRDRCNAPGTQAVNGTSLRTVPPPRRAIEQLPKRNLCCINVLMQLVGQLLDGIEAFLATQALDETNLGRLAVQIAPKVQ
jgi:hypothetical protein